MERFKKFAAPALAALVILLALFLLKSVPSSKLWKGYTTLSVPAGADKASVNSLLRDKNCGDYIALEAQEKKYSNEYESAKQKYFFDKESAYRIYYIPDSNIRGAQKAAREIQDKLRLDAVLGSRASFPYFTTIITLLVFAAFFFFAENKIVFAAASLPAIFFAFCNPFYAAAASVCLELYALFLAQKTLAQKGVRRERLQKSLHRCFFDGRIFDFLRRGRGQALLLFAEHGMRLLPAFFAPKL